MQREVAEPHEAWHHQVSQNLSLSSWTYSSWTYLNIGAGFLRHVWDMDVGSGVKFNLTIYTLRC